MSIISIETCFRVYLAFFKVIQVYYKEERAKTGALQDTTSYRFSPRIEAIFVQKRGKCDDKMWSMAGYFQIIKDVKIGSRWVEFDMSHINQ